MATSKKTNDQRRTSVPTVTGHHHKNTSPDKICNIRDFIKKHPFLSQLLRDDGIVFECDGEAPSPSKDYGQLQITLDKVIIRWWKITLRNIENVIYPGEIKDSYEDFYDDEAAQREVWRIFGQGTVDYCINLVCGKFDWLARLPPNIQIHILSHVNLDDIPQISLVSKSFRSLCRNNDLWRIFYIRYYGRHALENKDLIHLAERRGWRHVFFTNRLKLQMELRREAQIENHHPEDPSDLLIARERRSRLKPSSPRTPRQQPTVIPPSVRRHSFATRKEPPPISPRLSLLPNEQESPRTDRSTTAEVYETPRTRRPPSPASSVRSFAGSTASTSSAQQPVKPRH